MNTYNLYDEGNRKHNYHTHIYSVIHKDSIDESIMCKIHLETKNFSICYTENTEQ